VNTDELDKIIEKKYPNSNAFQKDIPNILIKLGFKPDKAEYIASKIQTDAGRGAGHAWGAEIKGDKARLRTRIGEKGMNYQGFNVAMHELGHCVEQTISLYDIDYYMLKGVPNTAFTEALAFIFQGRDLDMLGIKNNQTDKSELMALDIFWSNYEIMGVSLVDMNVWKWLYQHPDATKEELKEAVIKIAKEIWNKYYADVFGVKDQPILAIYSHMINFPLYLSAYPIGYLINFQIEKYMEGKNFADEVMRIYSKGRLIPQLWMKEAVGEELSNKPLLEAVDKALVKIK
jgi:oligoendopeptidase F